MVIKELLDTYKADLLEPIMILSKLMKVDKSYVYTHIDEELDEDIVEKFYDIMDKRKEGYPIQYLLNEREFMGLNLFVDRGVLIPRNDTEILVEYLIDYIGEAGYKVFEIGVGSGAISVSLGHFLKNVEVLGVDISEDALKVANENIKRFKLKNVSFQKGDLFKGIDEKFNVIVSNPPYIKSDVIDTLDREVKDFEPMLALDGGESGLEFYEEITKKSGEFLKAKGLLIFEIGYDQGPEVSKILMENSFVDVEIIKDLQGHDRVVLGFLR